MCVWPCANMLEHPPSSGAVKMEKDISVSGMRKVNKKKEKHSVL